MIKLIAAIGANYELGKDNTLMWDLPGDMKFFRTSTAGSTVIMGRKTYESIGRPLPKRRNIVITRNPELNIEGVEIVSSLEDALALCENDAYIIGGASVYSESLKYADEIILTEIKNTYPEADVYFPRFDKELYTKELIASNSDNGVEYDHVSYKKRPCEEILSIDVKITSFHGVETKAPDGSSLSASMISFSAETKGRNFSGSSVSCGVDTQRVKNGRWELSARYMLEGEDANGQKCRIFIENNGADMENCTPSIVTDSELLADWNTATLRSRVLPSDGGVNVIIYKYL